MADATARLLNLIVALTDTGRRMTRETIRATVEGYDPVPQGADAEELSRSEAAFERMFERDKDALRSLGIPLRTIQDAVHGDDIGYRIDSADAALPALDLTAAELAVLSVAGAYWEDATLGDDARQALTKVASAASSRPTEGVLAAARTRGSERAVSVLLEARDERRAVTFDYSSTTSGLQRRTVQPWRLLTRSGVLYVQGLDTDRGAPRTFRLSRVQGRVRPVGDEGAYEIPPELPAAFSPEQGGTALVAIRPEAGHALRARGEAAGSVEGWDLVRVEFRHPDAVRDEVLALGGAARIVEPAALAEQVAEHARRALEVAGG
ncbi:helix-turn-helix transcriptional regulator [Demequina zhanjiangensis]|uniref:WYL domain-containing protein n=1 Tax=Demequina zhanjiangensis TaxID=3051659 RepID=A0ABT8G2F7_9MICO|nr:WYL domain-containing protein [Demequina sp. SYSU T00b26]MDN4473318.1 WYL domain-containing protein [Demequina sp. SYSU T00b26]